MPGRRSPCGRPVHIASRHRARTGLGVGSAGLLTVVLLGCGGGGGDRPAVTAQPIAAGRSSIPSPSPAPDPAARGPWSVGGRTLSVPGRPGAPALTADVWYPTAASSGAKAAYGLAGVSYRSDTAYDATPPIAGRRFPLVVFSHGYGGIRFQSSFLTELLASHGFVVAAADHPGSTVVDEALGTADNLDVAASHRPADLEALAKGVEHDPATAATIDPAKVAVVGHSLGGTAALAVGGHVAGTGTALAHPSAVVALAPASEVLSDDALRADTVPTLLMVGTQDVLTPPDLSVKRPLALVPGRPLASVLLDRATHYSFTDLCRFAQVLRASSLPAALTQQVTVNEGPTCGPTALPIARAHALIGSYTVAFLLAHVAGDARYATPTSGLPDATLTVAPPR